MPERNGRTGRAPVLLVVVLLLVLGSFGLLVVALVTGQTSWAWGSVAASAVAGVLLVTDWIARPKVIGDTAQAVESRVAAESVDSSGGDTSQAVERYPSQAAAVERSEASTQRTGGPELGASRRAPTEPDPDHPAEPD